MGDNLVPDYVTRVRPGAFYGWPWFYIGANQDPRPVGVAVAHDGALLVTEDGNGLMWRIAYHQSR